MVMNTAAEVLHTLISNLRSELTKLHKDTGGRHMFEDV